MPTKSPVTTRLFEVPVPAKRRSVALPAGDRSSLSLQLLDPNGDPVDLTDYTDTARYTPCGAYGEAVSDISVTRFETGSLGSPLDEGWVDLPVPAKFAIKPGVYLLQAVITDDLLYPRASSDGEVVTASARLSPTTYRISTLTTLSVALDYDFPVDVTPAVGVGETVVAKQQLVRDVSLVFSNILYLVVERALFGAASPRQGPPTIAEVRLALRDYPETNLLLDDYEFDDAEIALAASRIVDYFNELAPPLGRYFTTDDFPWRFHWLEGIAWQLFITAAHWHRRGELPYSAGGVQINDIGKEKQYLQAAMQQMQLFKEWASKKKVQLNMEDGFGGIGSEYGWYW
jgi:hypothetical protein